MNSNKCQGISDYTLQYVERSPLYPNPFKISKYTYDPWEIIKILNCHSAFNIIKHSAS